ncbi:MAG: hypothetical protein R2699_10840 [Acidimicrobiales bacterium]|nr:hypothetical protein [Acidimicrobiales bacterium]
MGTMMFRVLRVLGRRPRIDRLDPAQAPDPPSWAVEALRSCGFEVAGALRLKPILLPASYSILLTHPTAPADARVSWVLPAGVAPTVGLTSVFGTGMLNTGQTGRGPLPEVLHQAFPGSPPLELVARHREAEAFLASHGVEMRPLDPAGAVDRYADMWHAEVAVMRAMPSADLDAMAAQNDDGGPLRGVRLQDQPDIEAQLARLGAGTGTGGAP